MNYNFFVVTSIEVCIHWSHILINEVIKVKLFQGPQSCCAWVKNSLIFPWLASATGHVGKLINIAHVAPVRVAPVWPRVLFVLFERSTGHSYVNVGQFLKLFVSCCDERYRCVAAVLCRPRRVSLVVWCRARCNRCLYTCNTGCWCCYYCWNCYCWYHPRCLMCNLASKTILCWCWEQHFMVTFV